MTHSYAKILGKLSDYKECTDCNKLNWYENETCCSCGLDEFEINEDTVFHNVMSDYRYWKQDGFCEHDIDNMTIEV